MNLKTLVELLLLSQQGTPLHVNVTNSGPITRMISLLHICHILPLITPEMTCGHFHPHRPSLGLSKFQLKWAGMAQSV